MAREAKTKTEPFEQIYARLEAHVAKLEQGGLSLDDAIGLYEEGMKLARQCQDRLEDAEQRITKLRESFMDVPRTDGAEHVEDIEYVLDEDPSDEDYP
jgi:exodeoxyribonuclease VII small subunit